MSLNRAFIYVSLSTNSFVLRSFNRAFILVGSSQRSTHEINLYVVQFVVEHVSKSLDSREQNKDVLVVLS